MILAPFSVAFLLLYEMSQALLWPIEDARFQRSSALKFFCLFVSPLPNCIVIISLFCIKYGCFLSPITYILHHAITKKHFSDIFCYCFLAKASKLSSIFCRSRGSSRTIESIVCKFPDALSLNEAALLLWLCIGNQRELMFVVLKCRAQVLAIFHSIRSFDQNSLSRGL